MSDLVKLKESQGKIESESPTYCFLVYPSSKYVDYIGSFVLHIQTVMNEFNLSVKTLESEIQPNESTLEEIKSLAKGCVLGIVILDGFRPNVLIEYGLLYGLGKPIIVLKDENAYINIECLYLFKKTGFDKKFIELGSNPPINLNEHLSDIRDLHCTPYNHRDPVSFMKILRDDFIKIQDKVTKEKEKALTPIGIEKQDSKVRSQFSILMNTLARYGLRLMKHDEKAVTEVIKEIDILIKKYRLKPPIGYYGSLGDVYKDLKQFRKAIIYFDLAIKYDKSDYFAWTGKGSALASLNKPQKALHCFEMALKLKSNYPLALCNKAHVLIKLKRYSLAIDILTPLYREEHCTKKCPILYYIHSDALFYLKRYKEALRIYNQILEGNPNDTVALFNKGVTYCRMGKHKKEIQCYEQVLLVDKTDYHAWTNKGNELRKLKQYKEALICYNKALKLNQKYINAWSGKGALLFDMAQYSKALYYFEKVLEIDPKECEILNRKGITLMKLNQLKEAIACFDKAIEINPKNDAVLTNKGNALGLLMKIKEAFRCYEKALEINPKNDIAWANKANALDDVNKHKEALQTIDKGLEINPKSALLWNVKAFKLALLNQVDEALLCVEESLKFDNNDINVISTKAYILGKMKKFDEAIIYHLKAIQMKPGAPDIWYEKASTEQYNGKIDDALNSLETGLSIDKEKLKIKNYIKDFEPLRNNPRFKALIGEK